VAAKSLADEWPNTIPWSFLYCLSCICRCPWGSCKTLTVPEFYEEKSLCLCFLGSRNAQTYIIKREFLKSPAMTDQKCHAPKLFTMSGTTANNLLSGKYLMETINFGPTWAHLPERHPANISYALGVRPHE
jgi:hypothetical protein